MRCAKAVVFALAATREPADTVHLAQGVHLVAPAGQNLVRIGLVAHVPHQTVMRRVEHRMQGDGEFNGAQVGA
jgi:hypothetical protein